MPSLPEVRRMRRAALRVPPMAAFLREFRLWLAGGGAKIKPKRGGLVPLIPNSHQERILDAMYEQALRGRPVRIIVLKARQLGCSTLVQALFYFASRVIKHWLSVTVAHKSDSTRSIFKICKRLLENDRGAPKLDNPGSSAELVFAHDSSMKTETAGGRGIGRSLTINALHCSEEAFWPGDVTPVDEQMAGLTQAVPDDAMTIVVIESTSNARDPSQDFEKRFKAAHASTLAAAVDPAHWTSGEADAFTAVFSPWFEDAGYVAQVPAGGLANLDDYERWLREKFALSDGQLQWRRDKIKSLRGDVSKFTQEYPATVDEAFAVARGRIFPMLRAEKHGDVTAFLSQPDMLLRYEKFRGVDWGGAHPFVCVWVAFVPGPPGFFVDTYACPNTWRQLTGWSYDEKGKPRKTGDDAIDAVRYVITTFNLDKRGGAVLVYRELFIEEAAYKGLSELNLAAMVKEKSAGETYSGTCADLSRPTSINMFCQLGIPTVARAQIDLTDGRGEIECGIAIMEALMKADLPLVPPLDPPPIWQPILNARERAEFPFGLLAGDLPVEMAYARSLKRATGTTHPWLGTSF